MENNNNKIEWWRKTTVYQIYPRSFLDSNGDGIGDIAGIISKLDYIKDLGFETIWVSPFFKSPQKDFGYDISDYYSVAPEYGSMEDVDALIREVHSRGMYIILDMVLNHTSDQHPWFLESRSSKENPKRDWYIWKDAKKKNGKPPTNWSSQTGGSGWHWDSKTKQYYWASFLSFQPDLNYRNNEVKEEIFKMLNFWLLKGADGFRLDIIGSIFEDEEFRDSPFIWKLFPDESNKGMLFKSNCMTENLPESMDFTKELRKITDSFHQPERFMVGETFGSPEDVAKFCVDRGLHSGFAFKCTEPRFTAVNFRNLTQEYEDIFEYPLIPVWAFSNHDRTRRISALGGNILKAKLNAFFQLTVRGIPFFYYGEEIGMLDADFNHRVSKDPVSFRFKKLPSPLFNIINRIIHGSVNRDLVRTPMQWNSNFNAGFCPKETIPWLPVNKNYREINVEKAKQDADSILNCIKKIIALRAKHEALQFGKIILIEDELLPKNVLGYYRKYNTEEIYTFLNFNNKKIKFKFDKIKNNISLSTYESRKKETNGYLLPYEGIILIRVF